MSSEKNYHITSVDVFFVKILSQKFNGKNVFKIPVEAIRKKILINTIYRRFNRFSNITII